MLASSDRPASPHLRKKAAVRYWRAGAAVLLICGSYALTPFASSVLDEGEPTAQDNVITLYAEDDWLKTVSFSRGTYGKARRGSGIYVLERHAEYDYIEERLSVIGAGGAIGHIENLGRVEGHFPSGAFYEVVREGDSVLCCLGHDVSPIYVFGELSGSRQVSVPISTGDICVMRIEGASGDFGGVDEDGVVYVKVLVLNHEPGVLLTIRWELF